ncbi:restriction endonuclease subunit S [Methylococcus geothermalis]|uniref:Restriction endonuclease subunit S n=1 Tax=Methylococcus geothermalis TaxID=2681310 RepID=A0A858QBY1_9GAMM|nr:restriction endonuclease subunit S [Methylococcus geothermalis]
MLRNGRLFGHRVETGFPDLPILEVSLRTGVRVRDMENLKRKQVMSQKEKYKRAVKGDIVYNMMRMWQGAVGPAPVDGLVSPAYVVVKPYDEANSSYYSYLFRTAAYMQEVNKFSRGIVADRNRLYWESFKQMPSLVPPRPEQDQIVAYLRAQDAHIARFIKAKRELIKLLTEQKLRIIDHAVTRGLDPSVPLKPSGIEWLGEVPEHWKVERLKWVCRFTYGGSLSDANRRQGNVPVYGSNGQVGMHDKANTLSPCIVIGRKGSFGKVNYSERDLFAIDTTYFVDRKCTNANIRWLYYLLVWCQLDRISKDSAVPGLDRTDALNTLVPVPDYEEQERIANQLDSETAEVNDAIARTEDEIKLIREYRDRLIADVVTGQVDVRGWQPGPDDVVSDEELAALSDEGSEGDDENDAEGEPEEA